MQYCVIPQIFVSCLLGSQLQWGNYMAAENISDTLLVVHLGGKATTDQGRQTVAKYKEQMEKKHSVIQ